MAKNSLRDVKSKPERMSKMKWKRNTLQNFLEETGSEDRSYNSPWKKKEGRIQDKYFKWVLRFPKIKKKKEVEMQRLRDYIMSQEKQVQNKTILVWFNEVNGDDSVA